jgi:hypothetical protein
MPQFPFKSYCWVVGTTSFRTVDFNVRIERQLALLNEFWAMPENAATPWRDAQLDYYRFIRERDFVKGDAPNPTKDAREKTAGLVAIGLTDGERKLTFVGEALLDISLRGDFNRNNSLQIPADSFIYLKQLLKTSNDVDGNIVRPFVVTAYAITRLSYLTDDEFTYLLPLCTTSGNTAAIITAMEKLRRVAGSVDEIIKERLMAMDNYKSALEYFLKERVTEGVITAVGMNRKSGGTGAKAYDKPYYRFYELLRKIVLTKDGSAVSPLYKASQSINGKAAALWRQYLFSTTARGKLQRDGLATLNDVPLLRTKTEKEFKRLFFEQMHLFKAKATLSDYADLNRRFFKTTDTLIFVDGKVEFDVLPRCWFVALGDKLPGIAFTATDKLAADIELGEIAPFLAIDEAVLYAEVERLYGIKVTSAAEANRLISDERYKRFNALIDERFDRNTLIELFGKFERREDSAIRQAVTNNADVPTIFEYILGIAWYLISDRKGDVLSYMNLSLEADLLPRTHAQGGNADIEYAYKRADAYPAHTLLIEATLADNSNQRRMEMEPVSRHLGEHILATGDTAAYCVFVSTFLHPSVVGDFRSWRTRAYYGRDYVKTDIGLKILPLATQEVSAILERGINYERLYGLFETAYRSDEPVPTWYGREVADKLNTQYCGLGERGWTFGT